MCEKEAQLSTAIKTAVAVHREQGTKKMLLFLYGLITMNNTLHFKQVTVQL